MSSPLLVTILLFSFALQILTDTCYSNGIKCDCDTTNDGLTISNCIRPGGWSNWSKWSKCREGVRKRRRKCNNPTPIGTVCTGDGMERKNCSIEMIPEYLFGSWSSWNLWSMCDCDTNLRTRSRYCQGKSCEGCDKQSERCSNDCPIIKKWTSWTEWSEYDSEMIRFSAYCMSSNFKNVEVGMKREQKAKELDRKINWSEWRVQSGVAYRYRLNQNSEFEVQHHLISRATSSSIPLHFLLPTCFICILSGFIIQYIISLIIDKCKSKVSYLSYSFDSNPNDYPSHVYRPSPLKTFDD